MSVILQIDYPTNHKDFYIHHLYCSGVIRRSEEAMGKLRLRLGDE